MIALGRSSVKGGKNNCEMNIPCKQGEIYNIIFMGEGAKLVPWEGVMLYDHEEVVQSLGFIF